MTLLVLSALLLLHALNGSIKMRDMPWLVICQFCNRCAGGVLCVWQLLRRMMVEGRSQRSSLNMSFLERSSPHKMIKKKKFFPNMYGLSILHLHFWTIWQSEGDRDRRLGTGRGKIMGWCRHPCWRYQKRTWTWNFFGHLFHSSITFLLCSLSLFWVNTNHVRLEWWEGQGLLLAQGFSWWALTPISFDVSEPGVHDSRGHLDIQILSVNGRNRVGSRNTTGVPDYLQMRVTVNLELPPRALMDVQGWRVRLRDKGQK